MVIRSSWPTDRFTVMSSSQESACRSRFTCTLWFSIWAGINNQLRLLPLNIRKSLHNQKNTNLHLQIPIISRPLGYTPFPQILKSMYPTIILPLQSANPSSQFTRSGKQSNNHPLPQKINNSSFATLEAQMQVPTIFQMMKSFLRAVTRAKGEPVWINCPW